MRKHQLGFTLVELMITVAIIAILTAIAYPSYTESVRRSNRTEAKTELVDVSQRLQRCYTSFGRFDNPPVIPAGGNPCAVFNQLTTGSSEIISRGSGFYSITFAVPPTRAAFTLVATSRVGLQQAADDECDRFTIDQAGRRQAFHENNSETTDRCWR